MFFRFKRTAGFVASLSVVLATAACVSAAPSHTADTPRVYGPTLTSKDVCGLMRSSGIGKAVSNPTIEPNITTIGCTYKNFSSDYTT